MSMMTTLLTSDMASSSWRGSSVSTSCASPKRFRRLTCTAALPVRLHVGHDESDRVR